MNLDPRSMRGILSRGKNLYPGGSPNPVGKNQYPKTFNPQAAAIQRIKMAKKKRIF